jgi:Sulfotransferase domain
LNAKNTTWPPLDSLIGDTYLNISGNVQFLLDFAILGFPKCGTSTMMRWLNQHPSASVIDTEVYDLMQNRPAQLVNRLYQLPKGDSYKRGYKSPNDIYQSHVLRYLQTFWPETRILVGLRHPVRWFESLYNFKVNNYESMKPPQELVGGCYSGSKGVCTYKAQFHIALARLGKTNPSSPEEQQVEPKFKKHIKEQPPKIPNKIFLFVTDQLADKNTTTTTRAQRFRKDIQHFLGFEQEMPPMIHIKPGIKWDNETQALKDAKKINICDSEYEELRNVLMDIAIKASTWIRTFFLKSDDVVVSSRQYVEEILVGWMQDPCHSLL